MSEHEVIALKMLIEELEQELADLSDKASAINVNKKERIRAVNIAGGAKVDSENKTGGMASVGRSREGFLNIWGWDVTGRESYRGNLRLGVLDAIGMRFDGADANFSETCYKDLIKIPIITKFTVRFDEPDYGVDPDCTTKTMLMLVAEEIEVLTPWGRKADREYHEDERIKLSELSITEETYEQ